MNYEEIKKDIMGATNVIDGEEFKLTLHAICEVAANIVKKTLGPFAYTSVLDNGVDTYSTKDGWSVLENLHLADPLYEMIYRHLKSISFTLNTRVGDGTTTALVVADHFVKQFELMKLELADSHLTVRQADLLDEIRDVTNKIIEELNKSPYLKRVESTKDIYNIAYVSTNRNEVISNIIKEIYDNTNNPNIHVAMSDTTETYYKINRGYKIDCHLMWPEIYCNEADEYLLPAGCNVYVFDHTLKYNEHFTIISTILSIANQTGVNAVIFAPSFDDTFLSAIGSSIKACQGMPNSALVQLSLTNSALKNYAMDFTALAGAQLFDYTSVRMFNYLQRAGNKEEFNKEEFKNLFENEDYQKPEDIINRCRGYAPRLTLAKKYALLEEYSKDTNLYKAMLKIITDEYEAQKARIDKHADTLDKDYMNAHLRYVKFIGNTGVIYVGGDSELSKKCLRDSVLDATLACRSAFEKGYIKGLNIDTLSVIRDLWNDTRINIQILHGKNETSTTSAEMSPELKKNLVRRSIIKAIGAAFMATSLDVMRNKFIGESDDTIASYEWKNAHKDFTTLDNIDRYFINAIKENVNAEIDTPEQNNKMIDIIHTAMIWGECYDIVTEEFGSEEDTVINSVDTDCEILRTMTSIISMLLSSNQMISISRRFDAEINKERTLQLTEEEHAAKMRGYLNAMKSNPNPLNEEWVAVPKSFETDFIPTYNKNDLMRLLREVKNHTNKTK